MHRLLQHSVLFMKFFQDKGISLGASSEQSQEACNWDNKNDTTRHSRRKSTVDANIDVFRKSWWTADYCVMEHYKD